MTRLGTWASASWVLSLGILLAGISDVGADNPIVQTIYTADAAPMVYDNRVYIFTGHDEDGSTSFNMRDWRLFSSADMVNWQHHPSPIALSTFGWASARPWAAQVIERNGRFFFYAPVRNGATGRMAIGVGVSDTIAGPYADALGGPLLENGEIDPTVFIDDDGQAYLYWGNPNLWYVKLNEDMISYSGDITQVELTVDGFGSRPDYPETGVMYQEGPWLYKRDEIYYMIYAAKCCQEDIRYSTGPSATGPWTYRGIIVPSESTSDTNHPGIIEFQGLSYFVYHNGELPGGSSFTRSVAVESFVYNLDGSIPELHMTNEGPAQIVPLDPYVLQEAETIAWSEGVETEDCSEGGLNVAYINNNDYIKVKGVSFGSGATVFNARVASGTNGGAIELRLDSVTGPVIGNCTIPGTGGWQVWTTVSCPVSQNSGTHDLFFYFTGTDTDNLFNVNWWQFE